MTSKNSQEDANRNPKREVKSDSQKTNPAVIDRYIKGIHFPASKKDLLGRARKNSAPDDVMRVLSKFSEHNYNNVTDVTNEIGQVK